MNLIERKERLFVVSLWFLFEAQRSIARGSEEEFFSGWLAVHIADMIIMSRLTRDFNNQVKEERGKKWIYVESALLAGGGNKWEA